VPGAWSNDATDSLTLPSTAGPTDARIFIGQQVPAGLNAWYLAHAGDTVIGCILFYSANGSYWWIALLTTGSISIGLYDISVPDYFESMYFAGSGVYSQSVVYEDSNGNTGDGVWNDVSFNAGWSNAGGAEHPVQYRRVASPNDTVWLVGTMLPGTKADGTIVFTLPVGFRPSYVVNVPVMPANATPHGVSPFIAVQTNGDCKIYGVTDCVNARINGLIALD
jgi:hypothetical protein